ncbi:L,D-transpeptidase family protein [Limibaculum sp. FT325]|uniref:L,D-transpeptidase family protein n=1 Tax=Thermohalobaculum sediminis TaxID=2939436 RepID=UPI0020C07140|nr:L,D-transpeptidase family protein [Limibaculum sediminis]MCL5778853.1 L,D-transpeptidase family protein [Limibaculum sediminis]
MKRPFLTATCCAAGLLMLGIGGAAFPAAAQMPAPVADSAIVADTWLRPAVEAEFRDQPDLLAVYAARGFQPLWIREDGGATEGGAALLAALSDAPRHALPADRYARALASAGAQSQAAVRELTLTRAFLDYARDISSGLLTPRAVDRDMALRPQRPEPAALLAGMSAAADPARYIEALAPADAEYTALVARMAELRRLASQPGSWGPTVDEGPTLREGSTGSRVLQLRARLTALGDHGRVTQGLVEARAEGTVIVAANDVTTDAVRSDAAKPAADPSVFDAALAEAVRRFQRRHGLNEDGAVGPATRAQLNLSPAFRADQIAVNLERIRWLNRDLGRSHIMVNIAGFSMRVMDDGREIFQSRVVVGTKRHQTPEFSDEMDHLVINPTWFVPRSIAVNEFLPKLREDPGYLERRGYVLKGADPWAVDWESVTPSTFPGTIRQVPGEENALGRVKFMFPNDYSIYLHDTPQRHLFARDLRAYSHGCVRVEKPQELAHLLLSYQEADPAGAFQRWLDSGRERYVTLEEHLPVHITYRTAWVGDAGLDQFRGDIYGRDEKVMAALRKVGVALAGG